MKIIIILAVLAIIGISGYVYFIQYKNSGYCAAGLDACGGNEPPPSFYVHE